MKKRYLLSITFFILLLLMSVDRYFYPFVVFDYDELVGKDLYHKSVSSEIKVYDWSGELKKLSYCFKTAKYCKKIDLRNQKFYQFRAEYPSSKSKERLCVYINDLEFCHKKAFYIDAGKFKVKAKDAIAIVDGGSKINYKEYFDIQNNISGLESVKCTEDLSDHYLNLICSFKSNNGYKQEAYKKIFLKRSNVLENKKIAFLGDSITKAGSDTKKFDGWAGRIAIRNKMNYSNFGENGASFTKQEGRKRIIEQLDKVAKDTDYIIIQGGINDAASGATALEIQKSLEDLFIKAQKDFPNTKISFIITYKTAFSNWGDRVRDRDLDAKLFRELCDKHTIDYLDLYDGYYLENNEAISYSELLQIKKGSYFANEDPQEVHLNYKAYDLLSPIIETWIKGL